MKRFTLATTLGLALLGGGLVAAQTPSAKPDEHSAHHPEQAPPKAKATPGQRKMKGGDMMGGGMMGGGMMGMCPGMLGGAGKVDVTKTAKGVTISITSDDPKVVARAQKMAEAMKLMHEAQAQP
jgi:hypothetical protein